jgi:hypothetical protein
VDNAKQIVEFIVKEWSVITQAPVIFVTATVLIVGVVWWLFHWRYGGRIDSLKEQVNLYKSISEGKQLTSLPMDLFVIQQVEHKLGVRNEQGGFVAFDPVLKPKGRTFMLRVTVSVIAVPDKVVEYIELEMMGKRISSNWESLQVHVEQQQYIYFDMPKWVNSGHHAVKLIARSHDTERSSPSFDIDIPRA